MNKTIFITGSTDGIGKLLAIRLANEGYEVLIHGRNPDKVKTVVSEIKASSKNENIKGFVADLSDLKAVKRLGMDINERFSKIDVLINNAGIYKSPIETSSNGLDIRFAVNYFAPFVLTDSLLPLLKNADEGRIINLSSAAQSKVHIGALNGRARLNASEAYAQSKLALTMWSFYLSEELQDIEVIAVNPGSLLNTRMVKEAFGNHWSPATKGSDILFELATVKSFKTGTKNYFDNDKGSFSRAHQDAYDSSLLTQLLDNTNQILNEIL
ncbi:SDR family NAD(P)-dependent oxidoreductase [Psychroserpens sp.]|uniref:SDR family NAD(P)-dependent oxidoreductase n=1 Tax=Psychroserpens sp. TaxID=2020870 RepID=UPI001B0EE533|nr:SDR family NAD(P)-dependent oxidoreductase [Psychroserpens sp.]MBO6607333.1 SDR family NAD(P)-dependent oxidoreductase [Psychroserpens sp.]MBO6632246.1 SDR family NAD(P)-dependent oxidoreductase [Psychroserpens sp.]MBO6654591.1 SDR family NAD(P)-dependent oxidoreductase [Psychroserpens sp.]MBO6681062.1 SDR family NAD(P)-dependent oxidoreductase [Psychroserpens sp.]MBO6749983.1 SDR family NAD(P)-dependent oxidoreductase [Psychroserpens sp.]